MALSITHRFASAKADSSDTSLINPSNWNDTHVVSGMPFLDSTDFNFTAQSPGGTLTASITNTITLTPVPQGVFGTDLGHYLYISGGTGAAEAVLITGGTASSGGASGTITFIPANTHSGAWTIQSATRGIQEAELIRATIGYGEVHIPGGTHQLRAPITFMDGAVFRGDGASTKIIPASSTTNVFVNLNTNPGASGNLLSKVRFSQFLIDGATYTGVNAIYGIRLNLQNSGWVQSIAGVTIDHITFNNIRYAIYGERTMHVLIEDCHFYLNSAILITDTVGDPTYRSFHTTLSNLIFTYTLMDGTSATTLDDYLITLTKAVVGYITNVTIDGTNGRAGGIHLTHCCEGIVICNFSVELFGTSGNAFYGIKCEETTMNSITATPAVTQISNCVIDYANIVGISWASSTFGATDLNISDCYVSSHPTLGAVAGILINGTNIDGALITNTTTSGSYSTAAIWLNQGPKHVLINNSWIRNTHASAPAVLIGSASNYILITGTSTNATSGIGLTEVYGIAADRRYIGNTGSSPIPELIHNALTNSHTAVVAGNTYGRQSFGTLAASNHDWWHFGVNYNRTDAAAGSVDSVFYGTSEIALEAQNTLNSGAGGFIHLRVGATNTAPTDMLVVGPVGGCNLKPMTAPGINPSTGVYLYVDTADNKLKVRGASGTVTVLALP